MPNIKDLLKKNFDKKKNYISKLFEENTKCFRLLHETESPFSFDVFFSMDQTWFGFLYFRDQMYKVFEIAPFVEELNDVFQKFMGNKTLQCEAIGGAYKEKELSRPLNLMYQKNDIYLPKRVTQENDVLLSVRLADVLNPGLFMDQRENRKILKEIASNIQSDNSGTKKRLLNLFSFTGAFSLIGAKEKFETVSVDVSKSYLTWEKENHELNGTLSLSKRIPESSDLFLTRQNKRKETFHIIVVDPPTFSQFQGKSFQVKSGLIPLLEKAILSLADPGCIFVSCNDLSWVEKDFYSQMKDFSKRHELKFVHGETPLDFAQKREDYGLKSAFLFRNL